MSRKFSSFSLRTARLLLPSVHVLPDQLCEVRAVEMLVPL